MDSTLNKLEHKCPICDAEMNYGEDKMDHILLEEWDHCKQNHYLYEYRHGYYEVFVGNEQWTWDYSTALRDVLLIQSQVKQEITKQRELWTRK